MKLKPIIIAAALLVVMGLAPTASAQTVTPAASSCAPHANISFTPGAVTGEGSVTCGVQVYRILVEVQLYVLSGGVWHLINGSDTAKNCFSAKACAVDTLHFQDPAGTQQWKAVVTGGYALVSDDPPHFIGPVTFQTSH